MEISWKVDIFVSKCNDFDTKSWGGELFKLENPWLVQPERSQGTMRVNMSNPFAIGLPVRKYMALDAKERGGTKVAWHKVGSPDAVKLTKNYSTLVH